MLVLSRREGQSLLFVLPDGGEIRVTINQGGHNVICGIEAPPEVKIWREEVIKKEESKS